MIGAIFSATLIGIEGKFHAHEMTILPARIFFKEIEDLKSAHDSNVDGDVEFDDKDYPIVTKYDADNSSSVTWLTEATSALMDQNPS